jgi:hypothetical protein
LLGHLIGLAATSSARLTRDAVNGIDNLSAEALAEDDELSQ